MKKTNSHKIIVSIGTIIISLFLIYTLIKDIKYGHFYWEYDALASLFLIWFLFLIKDKIQLHPFHFSLAILFFVMHLLGVFGAYTFQINWFEYDLFMHLFFGFVAALIVFRIYDLEKSKEKWMGYLFVFCFILGVSAMHEIIEAIGAIVIGSGEGFIGFGPGDFGEFDSQIDLLMNLFGSFIGFFINMFAKN